MLNFINDIEQVLSVGIAMKQRKFKNDVTKTFYT